MFLKLTNNTINTDNITNITFNEAHEGMQPSSGNGVFFAGMPPQSENAVVQFTESQSIYLEGEDLQILKNFLDNQE